MKHPELIISRAPRENGIMMTGQMVRAILGLEPRLKRMTRRGYNPKRPRAWAVGDILYVKETSINCLGKQMNVAGGIDELHKIVYRATATKFENDYLKSHNARWLSAMMMPKERARIWLRILDLKIENLFDITDEDARRESFKDRMDFLNYYLEIHKKEYPNGPDQMRAHNPLVWAIEFERMELTDIEDSRFPGKKVFKSEFGTYFYGIKNFRGSPARKFLNQNLEHIFMESKIDALKLAKYLITKNVGVSARTIISEYFKLDYNDTFIPLDSSDWGRCMDAITLFGWDDISFMKNHKGPCSEVWAALADNFALLRDWHNAGEFNKVDDLIHNIRAQTPKANGHIIIGKNGIE